MSFFMRSLLRTIPLIGALLISALPVQAIETFDELEKACDASEENSNLCVVSAQLGASMMMVTMLCNLEAKCRITKENIDLTLDEWNFNQGGRPLLNGAVEETIKMYPECSIKPIP